MTRLRGHVLKLTAAGLAATMLAAIGLASLAWASSQFKQTAKVTLTAKKAGASTGFKANLQATDPGAPLEKPQGLKTLTIAFPAKTSFNFKTKALALCKASDTELVATGGSACPAKSKLGSGGATANGAPVFPKIAENVTAYAASNQIVLLLAPKVLGAGSVIVLHGKISGNTMTTQVPPLAVGGLTIVITGLELSVKSVGSGKSTWAKAGKCSKGKFTVKSSFVYETGEKQTISSTSSCK
ncbi:MAG: hypothetical protein ACRDK4_05800 [Solirubrobacteraceae bacterium]